MARLAVLLISPDEFASGAIENTLAGALGLCVVRRSSFSEGDTVGWEESLPALVIADASDAAHGAREITINVKHSPTTSFIPVIALVPKGGNKLGFQCLQAGANAVLETPLNHDELVGTIWWLLRDVLFKHLQEEDLIQGIKEPASDRGRREALPAGASVEKPKETPREKPKPLEPAPAATEMPTLVDTPSLSPELDLGEPAQAGGGAAAPSESQTPPGPSAPAPDSKSMPLTPPSPPPQLVAPGAAAAAGADAGGDGPTAKLRLFGYEIEGMIGSGGMASVYRARQMSLDRAVAIKVIARDLAESAEFSKRFIREAKVQASLAHPNIVQVHDLGSSGPLLYIVMEYIEGQALSDWIEDGRLKPIHWVYVAHVMGEVLSFLHARKIIHRDIKPSNLIIGKDGALKLADFGIAYRPEAIETARLTAGRRGLGTPYFMPPEQKADPVNADHRADIYALAVLLHVMMVGGITQIPLPPLRFYLPNLPASADAALRPSLETNPNLRPGDVRELTETYIAAMLDVVRATSGVPVRRGDLYTQNPFVTTG